MQLRESKTLCSFNNHHRRIRYINANLNHRCRNEEIMPPLLERPHHFFLFLRRHSSMKHGNATMGKTFHQSSGLNLHIPYFLYFVRQRLFNEGTNHKYLSPLLHLPIDELFDCPSILRCHHFRMNRLPIPRLFRENGEIVMTVRRERERARDGRCRHRQEMWISLVKETLPLHNTKSMLFIHDDKQEITKSHVFLDQCMCPNHEIDRSCCNRSLDIPSRSRRHGSCEQSNGRKTSFLPHGSSIVFKKMEKDLLDR